MSAIMNGLAKAEYEEQARRWQKLAQWVVAHHPKDLAYLNRFFAQWNEWNAGERDPTALPGLRLDLEMAESHAADKGYGAPPRGTAPDEVELLLGGKTAAAVDEVAKDIQKEVAELAKQALDVPLRVSRAVPWWVWASLAAGGVAAALIAKSAAKTAARRYL
jgi:hypothetical protein